VAGRRDGERPGRPAFRRDGDDRTPGSDRRGGFRRPDRDEPRREPRTDRPDRTGGPSSSHRTDRSAEARSGGNWRDRSPRGDRGPQPAGGDRPVRGGNWRDRRPGDDRSAARGGPPRRPPVDQPPRPAGPEIPDWADPHDLDPAVRAALRGLEPRNAERVAQHLVVAGTVVDDDAELALTHARAARDRASRVAAVREAVGVAAYAAGDYAEAARELRAYRRMSGDEGYRAVLADCERAVGRPEIALRLVAEALAGAPGPDEAAELYLVEAGARRDLGEDAAARLVLESALGGRPRPEMVQDADPATLRLAAGYADLLGALGAEALAGTWTAAIAAADPENLLGIAEVAEIEFSEEDLVPDPAPDDAGAFDEDAVDAGAFDEGTALPDVPARGDFRAEVEAEVAELLGETGTPESPESPGDSPQH
jgi:hypothetical protein